MKTAMSRVCRGLSAAVIAVPLVAGIGSMADAAKLACKPDVQVTNGKTKAIKVLRFGYKDADGKDRTEGLDNKKLASGEEETWKNQKLQHVAEGNPISDIRIEYRDDTSGEGKPSDPWGPAKWTAWYTQTGDCTDSRVYKVEVGASATGSSTTQGSSTSSR